MAYTQDTNPFTHYDFNNKIANPVTREHIATNPQYAKKIYNKHKKKSTTNITRHISQKPPF